jgi:hypothetical protein
MDIKNIPVSIHVQYIFFTNIYLSYLINNNYTPSTVNFVVYSPVYSEKSHCSLAIFRVKARLAVVTGHLSEQ